MDVGTGSKLNIHISLTGIQAHTQPCDRDLDRGKTLLYFGYGSNLWQAQMHRRCPSSTYVGIARLKGYKWIIYEAGYANIVRTDDESKGTINVTEHDYLHEVWGLVYSLQQSDEERLDRNEGVPISYQKATITCDLWPTRLEDQCGSNKGFSYEGDYQNCRPDTSRPADRREMLVYINHHRIKESKPKEEYIHRMNMGIQDALKEGVPSAYVEQVIRKFIPFQDLDGVKA